jgi:hypothetical protein
MGVTSWLFNLLIVPQIVGLRHLFIGKIFYQVIQKPGFSRVAFLQRGQMDVFLPRLSDTFPWLPRYKQIIALRASSS